MKKLVLFMIACFLVAPEFVNAQIEQGSWFMSGASNLSFLSGKQKNKFDGDSFDNYKYTNFNLKYKDGYFVIKNLPVGLFIDLNLYSEKDSDDGDKYKETWFAIGPFARYYFIDLNNLMPYAEAAVGFGAYREKFDDDDPYKESYFEYILGGGISYFLIPSVALDLFLGYQHEVYADKESGEGSDETNKYIYGHFLANLGVVVVLGDEN